MRMLLRPIVIVLMLVQFLNSLSAEIFEECDGVEDGSFVASLENCQMYIYCDGADSMSDFCEDGAYFDGEACDAAENVYCPLDEPNPEPEQPEEPPETTTTTTTTAAPQTTATASSMEPITTAPLIRDHCSNVDDPQQIVLMKNAQSCTDYYLCYHGQAIEMHCTDHLHFNAHTGKCDFPENAQCMVDRPDANKCLPHITDFFPHPGKCNYFYYCIKGFLTVQQCPFYYGWDIERRSCVQMSQARCFAGAKKI